MKSGSKGPRPQTLYNIYELTSVSPSLYKCSFNIILYTLILYVLHIFIDHAPVKMATDDCRVPDQCSRYLFFA